jgi:hypothetical protein
LQWTGDLNIIIKVIQNKKMVTFYIPGFIGTDPEFIFVELNIIIPVDMITGHPGK